MNILKSAQDNWPEDEAAIIHEYWQGCILDGYTPDELLAVKAKDIAHMERVFSSESDAVELVSRFHLALAKLDQPELFSRLALQGVTLTPESR